MAKLKITSIAKNKDKKTFCSEQKKLHCNCLNTYSFFIFDKEIKKEIAEINFIFSEKFGGYIFDAKDKGNYFTQNNKEDIIKLALKNFTSKLKTKKLFTIINSTDKESLEIYTKLEFKKVNQVTIKKQKHLVLQLQKVKAQKVKKYLNNYNKIRPTYNFLTHFIKSFTKKYKIIDLNNGNIQQGSIFISNHSAANGPLKLALNFPYKFIPWGINNMCQGYKTRRRYLIDIFYKQKLKYSKFRSWIIGTLFTIISGHIYRNAGVIPTFEDMSLLRTINLSIDQLKLKNNILIFPEDSSNGYYNVLTKYFPGFAMLSKVHYKRNGEDLPIYPIYISKKKKLIIIEKPIYVNKMIKDGFSLKQIANKAKNITNKMYLKYVKEQKTTI